MWECLASYIIQECNPNDKVVEVGVGRFFKVAEYLQEHSMIDLILTDIKPSHPHIIKDDITNPRLEIYKGAIKFYKSLGFKEENRIPHYYENGDDAVVMKKEL